MFVVNKSLVTMSEGKLVAEASTLGLAPGNWPEFISVIDDANGEGFLFTKAEAMYHGPSDFCGFNYFSRGGVQLVVFND